MSKQVECSACKNYPQYRYACRECRGVGYFETYPERPANCTASLPECPVSYDPMCGGWECSRCGGSGPA